MAIFPYDWYWTVNDTSPGSQVFSSARGIFVSTADGAFQTWLTAGPQPFTIDTAAHLYTLLNTYAVQNWNVDARPTQVSNSSALLVLTNPLSVITEITSTYTPITTINLPQMNLPTGVPLGVPFTIINTSTTASFDLFYADGSSRVISPAALISPQQTLTLVLTDNSSFNGTLHVLGTGTVNVSLAVFNSQTAGTLPLNLQAGNYTTVQADRGGFIFHPITSGNATYTIDSNANVPYPIGTTLTFINQDGAGSLLIAVNSDSLEFLGNTGVTGTRSLAPDGIAIAIKVSTLKWVIYGVGLT